MSPIILAALAFAPSDDPPPTNPNVLYLMADDMRPQLGCYGHTQMHTPNLEHQSFQCTVGRFSVFLRALPGSRLEPAVWG